MKNLHLPLFLALLLATLLPANASVTQLLQSPQAPVLADSTAGMILFIANDGTAHGLLF